MVGTGENFRWRNIKIINWKRPTVTKGISVSIPDLTHKKLQICADIEGTSLADLASSLFVA